MGNETETAAGREQILRAFEGAFQARSFQREPHVDEREGADMAAVRMHTTGTITFLADNNVVEAVSRELFVLRKSRKRWELTDYHVQPDRATSLLKGPGSPLADSNRRPPPYHGGSGAGQAGTVGHS